MIRALWRSGCFSLRLRDRRGRVGETAVDESAIKWRILHFGVTAHPTAEWTVQQLREAFPWETAPRYLLRDRDRIFGADFVTQVKAMGINVERVIGTIRRECLDHVLVFSEAGLSRHLRKFAHYYHRSRTHLGLRKDTPEPRPVQAPEAGRIVAILEVGGLHHRYERRAA